MKIEKRPNGSYRVRMTENGHTYSVTFPYKPTEKEAYKALRDKIDNPTGKYDTLKFSVAAEKYIDNKSNVLSPSTIKGYTAVLRNLPKWFRDTLLKNIDQECVQQLINDLSAEKTPKTIRNIHGFISAVLGTYSPSVVLSTTLPQKTRNKAHIPTQNEVKKLLEHAEPTEYYVPIYLATLGLRRGEICALTLDDLSDENVLTISKDLVQNKDSVYVLKNTPKTDASNRTIILPNELADRIRKQGYVYKYYPNAIDNYLRRNLPKLGIETFSLHKLRHFFASYAHDQGFSDAVIQALGGWETDHVMKEVYRHALEQEQAKIDITQSISSILSES